MQRDHNNKVSWDLKVFRLKSRIDKHLQQIMGRRKTEYVWDRIPFYKQMWQNAALKISAQFIELAEGIWEIQNKDRSTFINIHKVQLDDPVISSLAGNKPFCYTLMKKNGIPVPKHITFTLNEFYKAEQFIKENRGYYVVKPAIGTGAGIGVTTHLKSPRECRQAAALASLYSNEILLESLVPGECYRLLVLNGKMIHAVRRRGIRAKGDGRSTLWQLIEKENALRKNVKGSNGRYLIGKDRDLKATLPSQGFSIDSVAEAGHNVLIKSFDCPSTENVEVRTIYDEVVTDLICPEISRVSELAAGLLNSRFAGIDVITLDPNLPLRVTGGIVNEINTNPGLHHHYLPYREGEDPVVSVLKQLLQIS